MRVIDPTMLETAFVSPDAPSFAEVLEAVRADPALSPTRKRDLASGLRRIAKTLQRPTEEIPADPAWLRPRLAKIAPAAMGISAKSWTNAVSDAKAAMAVAGIVEGKPSRRVPLALAWRGLWTRVLAAKDPSLEPALGRFVRFLSKAGVAPAQVADAHLDAYQHALALNEIRKSPDEARRQAAYGWNRAVDRIDGWPQHILTVPSKDASYALPPDAFPASFAEDLERFVGRLEAPDPLDLDAPARPLRPATVRHRRAQILRLAGALVADGMDTKEIVDLSALVSSANARRALTWMLGRNGGETSPGIADVAVALKLVARRHVKAADDVTAELERLAKRLTPRKTPGLTATNRDRLRPLQDKATLRRLLALPERLLARGAARGGKRGLLDIEMAVAIGILIACPIRRKNLVELHLERNLRRLRDGRVFLVFAAAEVKNARPIEFELPALVVEAIDRLVAARSQALCPAGTPWLFPRRDGLAPTAKSHFSKRVAKTIRDETGLEMHMHLFRHLSAMIWLEANPGAYDAARRLLGHAELSSTLDAYAGFEAGTATRLFAELIETRRKG